MEKMALAPGLEGKASFKVEARHLAPALGSGEARVLSTPSLVAGMEAAAMQAVHTCLEEHQTTVGIHIDIQHNAGTPLGMLVTFDATLPEVKGRKLYFAVKASDECGAVGEGTHERMIVSIEQFEAKINAKRINCSG